MGHFIIDETTNAIAFITTTTRQAPRPAVRALTNHEVDARIARRTRELLDELRNAQRRIDLYETACEQDGYLTPSTTAAYRRTVTAREQTRAQLTALRAHLQRRHDRQAEAWATQLLAA